MKTRNGVFAVPRSLRIVTHLSACLSNGASTTDNARRRPHPKKVGGGGISKENLAISKHQIICDLKSMIGTEKVFYLRGLSLVKITLRQWHLSEICKEALAE